MKQVLIETQLFKPVLLEGKLSERGNPLVEGILATAEVKMVMVDIMLKNYGNVRLISTCNPLMKTGH